MDLLIAFIASLLRAEFYAWMPRLSEWLIEREISRLVPELQDRYREEWKASLYDIPNSVTKVVHALSFVLARTVNKMNREFVEGNLNAEANLNEFDRALEPLAAKHYDNANTIRNVQLSIRQQLARLKDLDDDVVNRARDMKASVPELSDDFLGTIEDFEHLLVRALTRATTLTKTAADGFDHKIAQTDDLLQSIYAKRAHLHDMRHKREISATTLALCLEDLKQELRRLTLSIQDATADDGNRTRDEEHKKVMNAITTAINHLQSIRLLPSSVARGVIARPE
jgi:hypothetical protein